MMVGKRQGVAALREESLHCVRHCMAHRFNLATSQASKTIPYMKEVEKVLSDLYYYFGGSKSGNRKCELQEIQKILSDPLLKIKECHEIRWLAFFDAVRAVYICFASLCTYFNSTDDNSKAKMFREKFSQYKFLAVLALLMDILPSMSQMSKVLQKQDLDISCVYPALSDLRDKLKLARKGTTHHQSGLKDSLKRTKDTDGHCCEDNIQRKELRFWDKPQQSLKGD